MNTTSTPPTPFRTQEIGSLKKPRWLLEILRDRSISEEDKQQARDDLALLNLKVLEHLGLDYVYDGEARRVEMYEYPIQYIAGFEFCGKVRSWDNRYWRKARCVGPVGLKENYHINEYLFLKPFATRILKIPVTGAYTLADWSFNDYYPSREELILALARHVVNPLLRQLAAVGAPVIQLDEPAASTHPREAGLFVQALEESIRGVDTELHVHICYSADSYSSIFPLACKTDVTHYALELKNRNDYGILQTFKPFDHISVGVGLVDVHNDHIEDPAEIAAILTAAAKHIPPNRLYANPDCGFRTRARHIAFQKLRSLVTGAQLAVKALAV